MFKTSLLQLVENTGELASAGTGAWPAPESHPGTHSWPAVAAGQHHPLPLAAGFLTLGQGAWGIWAGTMVAFLWVQILARPCVSQVAQDGSRGCSVGSGIPAPSPGAHSTQGGRHQ